MLLRDAIAFSIINSSASNETFDMTNLANELIKRESATVKLSNGEIFEFPLVDNKDLFPPLFLTREEFNIEIQCLSLENDTRAMYKRKENIAYLICAWEKPEEINAEAMKEITSNPKLAYLLN